MSARVDRLIGLLPGAGVDLMLVTDLVNVRYLTGYTGSNGLALVGPKTRTFVTDFRYVEQAASEVDPAFERCRARQDLIDAVADALPVEPLKLGFEETDLTVSQHARMRELMPERVELVGVGTLVQSLRAVKEPGEVEAMQAAARLADTAYQEVVGRGLAGRTERAVAMALEREMLERGAQRPSFEAIVAAGAHGALPHAQPREVEIGQGDLVVIDWGARLEGYCSDCTRTVCVGDLDGEGRRAYDLVLEAQLAGLDAVRAGADARDVDSAARDIIEAAGHGSQFGHGLGHGVGLDIHESPRLSQRSEHVLQERNTVTVEPGVYVPDRFGIRIEDLVVVTATGCEILTSIPKQLWVTD